MIVFLALVISLPTGLRAQARRTFDTSIAAAELGRQYTLWIHAHHTGPLPLVRIDIPMLDIYSPAGDLVYHGTQTKTGQAAQVLNALPHLPSLTSRSDVEIPLGVMLEMTPQLAQWKRSIMDSQNFVVVSISVRDKKLKKSSPYYVQNQAVDSIPRQPGVGIDVVHIDVNFPGD